MSDARDGDDAKRRSATVEERTVSGAPLGGGSTRASSGAFDTVGGGDLGGPGSRDPGDSAGDLRPETARTDGDLADAANRGDSRLEAERLAAAVFGDPAPNEQDDQLRAQADAQGRLDARPSGDASRQRSGGLNNDSR